jgi:hypothetical protein
MRGQVKWRVRFACIVIVGAIMRTVRSAPVTLSIVDPGVDRSGCFGCLFFVWFASFAKQWDTVMSHWWLNVYVKKKFGHYEVEY